MWWEGENTYSACPPVFYDGKPNSQRGFAPFGVAFPYLTQGNCGTPNKEVSMQTDRFGGELSFTNAHLSMFGKSVVIDYEFRMHAYDRSEYDMCKAAHLVPFEIYPYAGDIFVGHVKVSTEFAQAADAVDLLAKVGEALAQEANAWDE